jgi:AhpD family alkylhydroperoxidase
MRLNLLRPVLGALGLTQIRHVAPVRRGQASPSVALVYRQIEVEFGVLAPPVVLHAPSPEILAATWVLLREMLIVPGTAPRAAKEAVATAVSVANACPYCATIHNSTLSALGITGAADAHPDLESLADWVLAGQRAGGPMDAPFPLEQAPQMVGMAVLMHYLNRMVNVFLRDVPLPPGVPEFALNPVLWVLGRYMVRAARDPHPPGDSLSFLPPAALPVDLQWTVGDSRVAETYARVCAAIEVAGRRSVSPEVRALVLDNLADWRGGLRGISRRWVDELVTTLPEAQRPAGRLALLVAFASYQVDRTIIDGCRRSGFDDAALVELCAWAAMAAARRVGGLLPIPTTGRLRLVKPESNGPAGSTRDPHSSGKIDDCHSV